MFGFSLTTLLLVAVAALVLAAAYVALGAGDERRRRFRSVADLVVTLVVAGLIAFVVQLFVVKPYRIPSGSMETTYHLGDRVIAARFWYRFSDPARGDIIVFHPNGKGDTAINIDSVAHVTFVKRLIGLPGDWLRARDGHVQVCKDNGESHCRTLREPYVSSTQADFGPIHVPQGRYFMMGDNRAESDDSRVWGPIRKSQMIGRAFVTYWPLTRISFY